MKPVSFETNGVGIPGQTLLLGPHARTRRLVGPRFVSDPFYNVLVRTEKKQFFRESACGKGAPKSRGLSTIPSDYFRRVTIFSVPKCWEHPASTVHETP